MAFPDSVEILPTADAAGGDQLDGTPSGPLHDAFHNSTARLVELLEGFLVGPAFANVRDPQYAGGAVGNGVADDTAAIQAAINAVGGAGGGVVLVPPGIYLCNDLAITADNVHLVGSGWGSQLVCRAGTLTDWVEVTGANCIVRDLAFNGNGVDLGGTGLVTIYRTSHCAIISCKATNYDECNAFQIIESSYCEMAYNYIDGGASAWVGLMVALNSDDGSTEAANYNKVHHNIVENTDGTYGNSIFVTSSASSIQPYPANKLIGNEISDNHCINAGDIGIEIGFGANKTRVIGNYVEAPSGVAGILTRETTATLIADNHITQCAAGNGISIGLRDALIANTDVGCYHATVRGNTVDTCDILHGIFAREVQGGLLIEDNYVFSIGFSNPGSGVGGITAEECADGTVINGNRTLDCSDHGIVASGGNDVIITANASRGNDKSGVLVNECSGVIVSGNQLIQNGEYGVDVRGAGSDDVRIVDNDMRGNTTDPFDWDGLSSNLKYGRNLGWVTEATGSDSVASGATTKVVTHGLDITPDISFIDVTPNAAGTNDYGRLWVHSPTSTQFTVAVASDPGASGLAFSWRVRTPA